MVFIFMTREDEKCETSSMLKEGLSDMRFTS